MERNELQQLFLFDNKALEGEDSDVEDDANSDDVTEEEVESSTKDELCSRLSETLPSSVHAKSAQQNRNLGSYESVVKRLMDPNSPLPFNPALNERIKILQNNEYFSNQCKSNQFFFSELVLFNELQDEQKKLQVFAWEEIIANTLVIVSSIISGKSSGLIYGEVQSGKTTSMTFVAAMAMDFGCKFVVFLSGRTNALRYQTQKRIQNSFKPRPTQANNNLKRQRSDEGAKVHWLTTEDQDISVNSKLSSSEDVYQLGVVKKIIGRLKALTSTVKAKEVSSPGKSQAGKKLKLDQNRAVTLPVQSGFALIIDDECDDASINNAKSGDLKSSPINSQIIELCRLWGERSRYIGYTATPQANILNSITDPLFPNFGWYLQTTDPTYIGTKMFYDPTYREKHVRLVDHKELIGVARHSGKRRTNKKQRKQSAKINENLIETWWDAGGVPLEPVVKALVYFVLSGAIRLHRNQPASENIAKPNEFSSVRFNSLLDVAMCLTTESPINIIQKRMTESLGNISHFMQFGERASSYNAAKNVVSELNDQAFSTKLFSLQSNSDGLLSHGWCKLLAEVTRITFVVFTEQHNQHFFSLSLEASSATRTVYVAQKDGQFRILDHYSGPSTFVPPLEKKLHHAALFHIGQLQDWIRALKAAVKCALRDAVVPAFANYIAFKADEKTNKLIQDAWKDLTADLNPAYRNPSRIEEVHTHIQRITRHIKIYKFMMDVPKSQGFYYEASDVVNANKLIEEFSIFVGGNILSRGVTIRGLAVSWYTRTATEEMMDTSLQHCRWFGRHPGYEDLVRIFTQERQLEKFKDITACDLYLRMQFYELAIKGNSPAHYALLLLRLPTFSTTRRNKNEATVYGANKFMELNRPVLKNPTAAFITEYVTKFLESMKLCRREPRERCAMVWDDVPLTALKNFIQMLIDVGFIATVILQSAEIAKEASKKKTTDEETEDKQQWQIDSLMARLGSMTPQFYSKALPGWTKANYDRLNQLASKATTDVKKGDFPGIPKEGQKDIPLLDQLKILYEQYTALLHQIELQQHFHQKESPDLPFRINIVVPTSSKGKRLQRKRAKTNLMKIERLRGRSGDKDFKKSVFRHEFLDAHKTSDNLKSAEIDEKSIDWFEFATAEDTGAPNYKNPLARSKKAPVLLLFYVLDPLFQRKGCPYFAPDAKEAGDMPLLAIAACWPRLTADVTVNKQLKNNPTVLTSQTAQK